MPHIHTETCTCPHTFTPHVQHIDTLTHSHASSNAHFRQSPVIDQLKSPKTDCSNSHQDPSPIKIQFWWSRVPLFSGCRVQACKMFSHQIQASGECKTRTCITCIRTACKDALFWLNQGQDQSTLAQRAETTVIECSRTSCV